MPSDKELMKSAAEKIRSLDTDIKSLSQKVKEAEGQKQASEKNSAVYKTVLDMVISDEIDVSDAQEKVAELQSSGDAVIAEQAKKANEKRASIGSVVDASSESLESDPLTDYLLSKVS